MIVVVVLVGTDSTRSTDVNQVTGENFPEVDVIAYRADYGRGVIVQRGEDGLRFVGPGRGEILQGDVVKVMSVGVSDRVDGILRRAFAGGVTKVGRAAVEGGKTVTSMSSMTALVALTPVKRSWMRFAWLRSSAPAHDGWLITNKTLASNGIIVFIVPIEFSLLAPYGCLRL